MNNIQNRLIKKLNESGFHAKWAGETSIIDANGTQSTEWNYIELGDTNKDINDFAVLDFDDPQTLEGCSLQTPNGLESNKQKYKTAWELSVGLYYHSIGGCDMYSDETNAEFNRFAAAFK